MSNILKDSKIDPKIIEYINEEEFCETFHKLPSEVREMDVFDYDVYCAILQGKNEGSKKDP